MIVVKIYMWPKGDQNRETLLAQGSVSCIGQANADSPEHEIRKGERMYRTRHGVRAPCVATCQAVGAEAREANGTW